MLEVNDSSRSASQILMMDWRVTSNRLTDLLAGEYGHEKDNSLSQKPGSGWILTAIFVQYHDQSIDYEK